MAGETPAPRCRNCNAAEFVGRTAPRLILDTAAAYLSGIGRKAPANQVALARGYRQHLLCVGHHRIAGPTSAAASPRASTELGIGSATRYTLSFQSFFRERTYVN